MLRTDETQYNRSSQGRGNTAMKMRIAACVSLLLASSAVAAQDDGLLGTFTGTATGLTGTLNDTLHGVGADGLLAGGIGLIGDLYPGLSAVGTTGGSLLGGVTGTAAELGVLVDATVVQLPALGDDLVLPGLGGTGDPVILQQLPGLDALPLPGLAGDWPTTRLPGVDALPLPGLDALPIPVR